MLIGKFSAGLASLHYTHLIEHASAATPSLIPASLTGCDFATGKLDASCIGLYIAYLIKIIFELTGAIFLLMIIIGGYQYVISKASGGGGDEGKARVRFAIVGFLVTALSFYIVDFILNSLIP
jgi:hypothetical protein